MNETSRIYYAWIARDKRGTLRLFDKKPIRFKWFGEWSECLANINSEDFPDVTWENGPQKVKFILRKCNEQT